MKIKDLIENFDKKDEDHSFDMETISEALDYTPYALYLSQVEGNERLKCYWAGKHCCTDTWVGVRLYYLDDVFVCMSYQTARKQDEEFLWVNQEAALKVRSYCMELDETRIFSVDEIDFEEEIGDGYTVEYTGQLLDKSVVYQDQIVEVVKDSHDNHTNFHTITIKNQEGVLIDVDVRDVYVPWPTK